ncbi:H(+)/Cl(-) exchange transporter 3 [Venturia nashicola]|uniref:alpha-galactosidase n=1 Tax=Venturia nashicola TaxID=86259 RepID=A0A4Z1PT65_9PEZI|nr:H(+)/Cl(-) exchange transporter 3 [Venturia nashicola]
MHSALISFVFGTIVSGGAIVDYPSYQNDHDNSKYHYDDPKSHGYPSPKSIWQPAVGTPYQMILTGVIPDNTGTIQPAHVPIFDIDLFYTNKSAISTLHTQGKKVICYFSAGSSEDWRPDYMDFPTADKGPCLNGWAGERYLNIRTQGVFNVMQKRIQLAAEKGCDAIDPDNVDGFSNENNFNLTANDAVTYIRKLANYAHELGMGMGLKNVQTLLPRVMDVIQFAVNEECALVSGECDPYLDLVEAGKPVFHVEYASNYTTKDGNVVISGEGAEGLDSETLKRKLCLKRYPKLGKAFSTTIKTLNLNGWVLYCDDRWSETVTVPDGVKKGLKDCPDGN